jgi:hypothetical protein
MAPLPSPKYAIDITPPDGVKPADRKVASRYDDKAGRVSITIGDGSKTQVERVYPFIPERLKDNDTVTLVMNGKRVATVPVGILKKAGGGPIDDPLEDYIEAILKKPDQIPPTFGEFIKKGSDGKAPPLNPNGGPLGGSDEDTEKPAAPKSDRGPIGLGDPFGGVEVPAVPNLGGNKKPQIY